MPWKLSVTAFVSRLGSLARKREDREINHGLLKYSLLLQTVFPTVGNMSVERSVADHSNALTEVEPKRGREKNHVKGAPCREVNSKVATAPNTQSRR